MARFEAAGIDLTGMVAASEDDWDRYKSLQWRAAVEAGGDEVMESHLSRRDYYLSARRAELGWAIFTGRVRCGHSGRRHHASIPLGRYLSA